MQEKKEQVLSCDDENLTKNQVAWGLDELEYLKKYGRKSSKRLRSRKAVGGYVHVYFKSF